jgi:hypothetical protein
MTRRVPSPILFLVAGLLCVALGYAMVLTRVASGSLPAWLLALGTSIVLGAMLALAAARPSGTPRTLRATVWLATVATFAGLAYALAAGPPAADSPLLLGLPRVTAVMLLVTGLIPLVTLPLAYARAFDRDVLGAGDVERVREAARAAAAPAEAAHAGTLRTPSA